MSVTLADAMSASIDHAAMIGKSTDHWREHSRSSVVGISTMRDSAALGELLKAVSTSVGVGPINKAVADAVREHSRSSVVGISTMRDSAALGELLKIASGSAAATAVKNLMEEIGGGEIFSTHLPVTKFDGVRAASELVECRSEAPMPAAQVDGAEIYAALVGLIVFALLAAFWLHEANRVGPNSAEINYFDLLQTGEWAIDKSLLAGFLMLACLTHKRE